MKYKRLIKALCFIEDFIAIILAVGSFIVICSEPVGDYTIGFIGMKVVALTLFFLILKIEGEE